MRTLWCSGSEKTTVFGLLNLHHCSRFQLLVSLSSTCLLIVLGPCHVPCLAVTVFCRLCAWAANTQQHILCVQLQQSRWWRPWHSLFLYLASLKLSRVTRDPICLPVCWPKVRAFSSDAQVSSDPPTNLIDYVNGFGHRLCCRSAGERRTGSAQAKMKVRYDRHTKVRKFSTGDKLLAGCPLVSSPFQAKFSGLFTGAKCVSDQNYLISTPGHWEPVKLFHVNLLKACCDQSPGGSYSIFQPDRFNNLYSRMLPL